MNKLIKFLTIFLSLLFSTSLLIFGGEQDSVTIKAFQLFDNNNFKEAAPLFQKLLKSKPELLMLNYYYGVCQTENKHYSKSSLNYLLKASQQETPAAIDYYLGIQYQAQNNWELALKHFNKFKIKSSGKEIDSLKINDKIQSCFNRENPYATDYIFDEEDLAEIDPFLQKETVITDTTQSETMLIPEISDSPATIINTEILSEKDSVSFSTQIDNIKPDSLLTENEIDFEIADTIETSVLPETFPEENEKSIEVQQINTKETIPINFTINSQISYIQLSEFKTEEGKELFEKGDSIQKMLDNNLAKIENLRGQYLASKDENKKNLLGEEILSLENLSYEFQEQRRQFHFQAINYENEYWKNASQTAIWDFLDEQEKTRENRAQNNTKATNEIKHSEELIDASLLFANNETRIEKKEENVSDELIYKIQIGAFSRGLPTYIERLYKKLSYIRKIENYTDEKGVVVYTTGNLTKLADAEKMQNQVRQEGVEDAFVVPYFKGKRITLKQAKELEEGL